MNIPNTLKVGGKVYRVEKTYNLDCGNVNCSGEIDYRNLVIRISPQADDKMKSDFLHEMFHAIHDHLGYLGHDEKKIDELANSLYMVIQDNPEMFAKEVTKNAKNKKS